MKGDKVSVIIPVFNAAKYLEEAVRSVLQQTHQNLEVVAVDDRSQDDSVEILKRLAKEDHRLKYFSLDSNSGAAVARNVAIDSCDGRYIAFLDADDRWAPSKLTTQIKEMKSAGSVLSCTAGSVINEDGHQLGEKSVPAVISLPVLLKKTPIITSSAMYDVSALGKIKMPDVLRRQDLGLWIEIISRSGPALGISDKLVAYRVHPGSLSRNKYISAWYTWRVIRQGGKIPFLASLYYFSHYAISGVVGRFKGLN